ncbi:glycosyltransferase family 4 protein [Geminocystis sp. NIES-3709]|uniref:glycosyltransferase family 4 protein n=1 Tax=Geminocystis sp. NIES-3709 TaxID=1617448 RepID=UPI0005FCD76D|nr:glycosyltransferase family 4 protein [Geminocystis sp. NIES-3709]BAQ64040.1 glycosyltransferase [Geminocystis sp. NIES-3709]
MNTQKSLRFCFITTFYPPYNFGGDGIFVQRLAHELATRGHSVDIIHCVDAYKLLTNQLPDNNNISDNFQKNITIHSLISNVGNLSPLLTHQTGFPWFKIHHINKILAQGFDVIHYHNISLVGGAKIFEYGNAIKLYTMHEYWLICPTHTLFKFNHTVCEQPNCFTCCLSYRIPPQLWRYTNLLKNTIKKVDIFISPSHFAIEKHKERGFIPPIHYLPNFVPEDQDYCLNSVMVRKPYFLFVGRLEKLKGLQTLIPLFINHPHLYLVIAGTGNYEDKLKKLAKKVDNIQFMGNQSRENLKNLYRNAIALIVPSVNFESAPPLVILEAFQQKTPVIVRNLGSMPEIIRESEGGFIYNNDMELITAINLLLDNRQFRDEIGIKGFSAYSEKWTGKAHIQKYFDLINQ